MDLGLTGKRVLVTAASQGLGFAIAKAFCDEGASVVICSRDSDRVTAAAVKLREASGNAAVKGYVCDLSQAGQIDALFESVVSEWGGIDILVNNAGGPVSGGFESVSEEDWQQAYDLTLMSVVRSVRRALPGMLERGFGRIVNVVSTSVKQPLDDLILSNTFRLAVVGLANSLAMEYASHGVFVNNVGPGRIETDRIRYIDERRMNREGISAQAVLQDWANKIPVGRYGQPDEFAGLAVYLGSPANRYITGQTVMVDGGMVRGL